MALIGFIANVFKWVWEYSARIKFHQKTEEFALVMWVVAKQTSILQKKLQTKIDLHHNAFIT